MLYGVYENEGFKEQIRYIFNLFFSIYGIEWEVVSYGEIPNLQVTAADVVVSYGQQKLERNFPHQIHIYVSHLFGPDYLKPPSLPRAPLKYFGDLPIIYQGEPCIEGHLRREDDVIQTDIDIVASSFFMLTRYEEILIPESDRFGRFTGIASLAYREGFLQRPIVNEYIDLLWNWISSFELGLVRKELWEGKDFAVCLTYDVDAVNKYRRWPSLRAIRDWTLKHRNPMKILDKTLDYLRTKVRGDPYNTFDYLMKLSETYELPSTFYFMSGGKTDYDNRYKIDDVRLISLMQRIRKRGNEIGLHSSFSSYDDPQMLKREKEELETVLGESVCGVRQHYLRWRTPDSWRAREEAGLKHNTSLSFADHEGFRPGICLPYKPFDVFGNRILNIWELPLSVMENSLFAYQGLSHEGAFQRIKGLVDAVKKHNGVFVILWHNSSLDDKYRPGSKHFYEEILHYLVDQNGFGDTVHGIIKLWEDCV